MVFIVSVTYLLLIQAQEKYGICSRLFMFNAFWAIMKPHYWPIMIKPKTIHQMKQDLDRFFSTLGKFTLFSLNFNKFQRIELWLSPMISIFTSATTALARFFAGYIRHLISILMSMSRVWQNPSS